MRVKLVWFLDWRERKGSLKKNYSEGVIYKCVSKLQKRLQRNANKNKQMILDRL